MKRYLIIALFFAAIGLNAKEPKTLLKKTDIRESIREILAYHVESKEFSALVVKRSFKVFIEQFDPRNMYLLKSEVEPFLSLSDEKIQQIISDFHQNRYPEYENLNEVIQKSILRCRKFRENQKAKILSENAVIDTKEVKIPLGFAESQAELEKKNSIYLNKWLQKREEGDPELFASRERLDKTLKLWENKKRRIEQPYLNEDHRGKKVSRNLQEHHLSLHILKATVRSLDAHSAYYSPDEAYDFRALLKKQFSGVGLVLQEDIDGAKISDLLIGSPAHRNGQIMIGDYLFEIDGKYIRDRSFEDVLNMMKGPADSEITLGLLRQTQEGAPVKVYITLIREKIVMEGDRLSFSFEPYGDGIIGKVSLPSFYDNGEGLSAEKDFRLALRELKAYGKLYGLVVDMRDNSGGFLTQAVKVAGLFIPKGVIVISKYRDGEIRYTRDIDGRIYYNGPLVLLTSKASASATEIVAGSLQDYGVAIIVGDERTYGKGSMQYQTITEDDAKAYFKVTVGRYYTFSGRSTQIDGVLADIVVPTEYAPYNIGERYLEFPLTGDSLNSREIAQIRGVDPKALKFFQKPGGDITMHSPWNKMLVTLNANSQKRLKNNTNFQAFLEKQNPNQLPKKLDPYTRTDFGVEDLQVIECTYIIKDMIMLSQ